VPLYRVDVATSSSFQIDVQQDNASQCHSKNVLNCTPLEPHLTPSFLLGLRKVRMVRQAPPTLRPRIAASPAGLARKSSFCTCIQPCSLQKKLNTRCDNASAPAMICLGMWKRRGRQMYARCTIQPGNKFQESS